jgi:HEAT repeat protein
VLCAALIMSVAAPWADASEVSDGLAKLDAIVLEAGGTEAFLSDSPQGQAIRDRYYQQWVSMYPQGESQFPRPNFDAVIAQARKAVKEHAELGSRLFETTGLGKTFSVTLDAESSGLELKQDEWKKFYNGWKRNLEAGSKRLRSLDEKNRESELQRLGSTLNSEIQTERAGIGALPKSAKLERGKAEAELQKRLLNDSRTQELAAFVVHEKVFGKDGEALRDILNSGDADQVLIGMKQVQQKGGLGVPESLQSYVIKSAVPALEQPKLEVSASGKAAESELFKVKLRKTNRGKLIPEGRVAKTTLEFQTIPRRIHGLFKGIAIQECVGGGDCQYLSPERWGTIALEDSQLHLVIENGSLTPGFTHGVPVKVGEATFLSMDIQAPALNKAGTKSQGGSVVKVEAYPLWLKEQQRHLPAKYRKLLVGSSTAMSNGGNRPTVTSSPSYLFGSSQDRSASATAADAKIRQVLLSQSGGSSAYGYGGNLITETTVQQAGALTQIHPSLENLSESQIRAVLERGRPELRERALDNIKLLVKKYPGIKNSESYWKLLGFGLEHSNTMLRVHVIQVLLGESGPEALQLKARALKDEAASVRWLAADSLKYESGPDALKVKAQALEHEDSSVRKLAASSLLSESGPEALKLKAKVLEGADPGQTVRIAESLANESGPAALKLKSALLQHEMPHVIHAAAKTLKNESGAEALIVKGKALEYPDNQVRFSAAASLANESGPEALKLKAQALQDPVGDVRWATIGTLANESGAEALRLRDMALKDSDPRVREAAAKLQIRVFDSPAAADAVVSIQKLNDSLAPASDPLCQGCLPAATPDQMRCTPAVQRACQRLFGLF